MKNNFKILMIVVSGVLFSNSASSQVLSNDAVNGGNIVAENPFFDASTNFDPAISFSNTSGKGLLFPRTNLTTWVFSSLALDGSTFPTAYDGMIVYNTGTGNTLTTGNNPSVSSSVSPGFYFFSNPDGDTNLSVTEGRWLPLGGSSTKSKTVSATADGVSATLPLATLDDSDLVTFLGAKIYDSTGKLVMTADSEYNAATNLLNTGNGFMYQVLAAGTYTVIFDYK